MPSGKGLIAVGSKSAGERRRYNWVMMFRLIAEVGMSGDGNEMTACLVASDYQMAQFVSALALRP